MSLLTTLLFKDIDFKLQTLYTLTFDKRIIESDQHILPYLQDII